jgi:solute:Na+ symporter, SSS family
MHSSLPWFDWLVVGIYMAAMILLGWRAGRGNKSLSDYFVGGRNVGGFAAGISLLASLVSTISFLSFPGEAIAHGTGFVWQFVALPIVFVIVGYFLIPHIMSFPVNSAYELLETRLGSSVRTLAACLFLLMRLIWMAFILHTASTAMSVIVGVSREWLVLALWLVTLIYTTKGGIRAVIWTDVAQFFILLGGSVFTVAYLMSKGGVGPLWLVEEGWTSTMQTPLFSVDPSVRGTAFAWFMQAGVWWIATCGSDQVAMQRFFTNRNAAVARRTLWVNLVGNAVSLTAFAAIGLTLQHYFNTNLDRFPAEYRDLNVNGDKVFPYFISHGMPTGLGGLVVAALLAAAMSCLSSGLNSLSAVLTADFFHRDATEKTNAAAGVAEPRRAQITTLMIGVLTLAIGLSLGLAKQNLMELASRSLEPLGGPLFGLFALAFFDRRASGRSAWTGFTAGLLTGYFIAYGHLVLDHKRLSFLWILVASSAATIIVGRIVARLWPNPVVGKS